MTNYNSAYTGAQIDAAVGAVASKANDSDVVHNTGNETVAGVKTFSSFPVTPSSAPTTNYQVANKKYIDDKVKTDVPAGAKFTDTVYTHPPSHPASMITESTSRRFVSDNEKGNWNSKTKIITSATEPTLSVGDQWHKEI